MTDSLREQLQAALGPTFTLNRELGGGGMSRTLRKWDAAVKYADALIALDSADVRVDGLLPRQPSERPSVLQPATIRQHYPVNTDRYGLSHHTRVRYVSAP